MTMVGKLPSIQSGSCLSHLDLPSPPPSPCVGSARVRSSSSTSCSSESSSILRFSEPAQTLIFFDWDDTLFPTTAIFRDHELSKAEVCKNNVLQLPDDLRNGLELWREALRQCLLVACRLGDRCTIVTNSRRPWVDVCIRHFAPDLDHLLNRQLGGLRIVYAEEVALSQKVSTSDHGEGPCSSGCWAWWSEVLLGHDDEEEVDYARLARELTHGKHAAMKHEATEFYSRYRGQTWKNILSFGDMKYEHDAVRELSASRAGSSPSRERLRTKTVLAPSRPSLDELTNHLDLIRVSLPFYTEFDGDIDLDLSNTANPLLEIASALRVPWLSLRQPPLGGEERTLSAAMLQSSDPPATSAMADGLAKAVSALTDWSRMKARSADGFESDNSDGSPWISPYKGG